jgi:surfeit locus 1 family protein
MLALSRRWIVLTVVVVAAVGTMVALGFWQLRRLHTVREDNSLVRARLAQPAASLGSVLHAGVEPSSVVYRRVRIAGRYDRVSEILVRNRSFNGQPGSHVLTPLVEQAGGSAIIVDRGWIPLDLSSAEEEATRPPVLQPVNVVGVLFPSERKGSFGPSIPPTGRLTTLPRIDVPRIAKQLNYAVHPLYLRLVSQVPPQSGELPVPPGLPKLSDGPHLSYAVQWFVFATLATVTYVVLFRRRHASASMRPLTSDMSESL